MRPEIHLFTSSTRVANTKGDEDEDIIKISSSEHPVKSRNKRPLSDGDDYDNGDAKESRIKRPLLRSLYDSDEEVKEVPKKVKGSKKKGDTLREVKEATKVAKKGSKRVGEVVASSRGGRAMGRGGKAAGRGGSKMKSKAVISDTSESEVEVPAAAPSATTRPKPRPAYHGANPTPTATPDKAPSSTAAADVTPPAPVPIPIQFTTTNVATTGSSLALASEASVEAHQLGHRESNGRNPSTVTQQELPAAVDAANIYVAKPDLPSAPTLTPTAMPSSAPVQSDLFDSLPSGDNNARSYAHDG
jgi:hypothetical protein